MMQASSMQSRVVGLALLLGMTQFAIAVEQKKLDEQLLSACRYGNLDDVAKFLEQGADANTVNEYGVSALHLAAREGNAKLIGLLIKSGANVNVKDRSGDTPLKDAA